ncbi:MAG: response regulator [Gammaproteobacteria bacterium]
MIRLVIADDHPVVREGLIRIIQECDDMELVGEAADGNEALAQCREDAVDVLLLDISMPGPGYLDILHRLQAQHPNIRVLVLSVHAEDLYAVRALKAGAAGYLTKSHSPEELLRAIREIGKGRVYVTSGLAERLAARLRSGREEILPHETLSDREFQVLRMLGAGKETNEIALTLALSPKTVSTYRSRIMDKMKLRTKGELIRYAVEHGLVE